MATKRDSTRGDMGGHRADTGGGAGAAGAGGAGQQGGGGRGRHSVQQGGMRGEDVTPAPGAGPDAGRHPHNEDRPGPRRAPGGHERARQIDPRAPRNPTLRSETEFPKDPHRPAPNRSEREIDEDARGS